MVSKNEHIYIGITNDPLVQIVSRMAAIYLRESMGYKNVYLLSVKWNQSLSVHCNTVSQFRSMRKWVFLSFIRQTHLMANSIKTCRLSENAANKVMSFGIALPCSDLNNFGFPEAHQMGELGTTRRYGWFYPKNNQSYRKNIINNLKYVITIIFFI